MKKHFVSIAVAACIMFSGCSGVSQEEYDNLENANSDLMQKNQTLNDKYDALSKKYESLEDEYEGLEKEYDDLDEKYNELNSKYSQLQEETKDWLAYSDAEKDTEIAQAAADKANAEAEQIEAEARLKSANEQLSQAEAEEQRRLDEGVFIYEDEYVKINYKSTGHPLYSSNCQVNFWVENKTNGVLTFQAECISLDGIDMGYISMSDSISPQSKGIISARTSHSKSDSPKTISGQLKVIDFDKDIFVGNKAGKQSYDVTFINVIVE